MGFYAPAQIVRDAREHGVDVRGVDVSASGWDCTLEDGATLRLGLRLVAGFREEWAGILRAAPPSPGSLRSPPSPASGRGQEKAQSFPSPACGRGWREAPGEGAARPLDFAALARLLPRPALVLLAEADAMRSLGLDRRAALWQVRGLPDAAPLPLFAALDPATGAAKLPHMALAEHVVADYQTTGLSLKAHPLRFLRDALAREGIASCAEATQRRDGARVAVAGIVLVRQRPGSAAGVVFATIEDETGIANVVVWPAISERDRAALLGSSLLLVHGQVQRSPEGIVHIVAERLADRSAALRRLDAAEGTRPQPSHNRPLPRSRDFR